MSYQKIRPAQTYEGETINFSFVISICKINMLVDYVKLAISS